MAGRVASGFGAFLCLAATGCVLPRADRPTPARPNSVAAVALPDNSSVTGFDNPSSRPPSASGAPAAGAGRVVPAGYQSAAPGPAPGGGALPSIPVASPGPPTFGDASVGADPHTRSTPTATGAFLNLGPGETATDRAVELMKRLETLAQENATLRDRIRTLEANGVEREQALRETLRETDRAAAEVQKARQEFETLRAEVTKLRDRARRVEDDEVETLRAVVDALKGLVKPPDPK